MKSLAVLLIGATIALPSALRAQDSIGYGAVSCAGFASDFKARPTATTDYLYLSWAQGWMSGMNFARLGEKQSEKDVSSMSPDEMRQFLRSYCDEHPLANVADATMALYLKLKFLGITPTKDR